MLAIPLSRRIRRTLGVRVGGDLTLAISETPTGFFPAGLKAPEGDNGLLDGSPRTSLAPWRLYWSRVPEELRACDRIEVPGDTTYELLAKPREITSGRRVVGHSSPVLPVTDLYPREAELKAMGGTDVLATVRCAIYSQREEPGQHAAFVTTFVEMPPSVWPHLNGLDNADLHFEDGSVWRVSEATLAPELPIVTGSIKRTA